MLVKMRTHFLWEAHKDEKDAKSIMQEGIGKSAASLTDDLRIGKTLVHVTRKTYYGLVAMIALSSDESPFMGDMFLKHLPEVQLDGLIKRINEHKPFQDLAELAELVIDYTGNSSTTTLSDDLQGLATEASYKDSGKSIPRLRERLVRVIQTQPPKSSPKEPGMVSEQEQHVGSGKRVEEKYPLETIYSKNT